MTNTRAALSQAAPSDRMLFVSAAGAAIRNTEQGETKFRAAVM